MPSLSKLLKEQIQSYTPLEILHRIAESQNKKQSNAERCLRTLTTKGHIVPVKNHKGHIIAYEPTKTITYREDPNDEVEDVEVKLIKANNYFLMNYMTIPFNVKNSFENFRNTLKKNKGEEIQLRTKRNIVKLYEDQTTFKA